MIGISAPGLGSLTARIGALPQQLAARLDAEVARLAGVLRDRIDRNLSGAVLQQRSGTLAGSIAVDLERSGLTVGARLGSDVAYAAIHEYGGTLPARTILPQRARALAFPWQGQQRFFKRVSLPAVAMPERSFLRSALDETAPEIRAAVEQAAFEVLQA